jgi:hypothetical protein
LIAIELKEDNVMVVLGHLLEFRCHDFARAAPANKEVVTSLYFIKKKNFQPGFHPFPLQ